MPRAKPKFIRTDSFRYFKIGKNRKKLQVWRGAKGVHSKLRRQRKGHPAIPTVGYMAPRKTVGMIDNKTPMLVHNIAELEMLNKAANIAIIARIGAKKKIEVLKRADELGIKVLNVGGKK